MLKTCNKCKEDKAASEYYANKRMVDGLNTFCKVCHKKDNVARKLLNRADPEFKSKELIYKKEYRERTVEQRAKYQSEWVQKNREHVAVYSKKYRQDNKSLINFLCQKRKIALIQRTPKWLSEDELWMIAEAYAIAALRSDMFGFQWDVDHIIPLRGKNVSGLHTPYNLQVIPAVVNRTKNNRYRVE